MARNVHFDKASDGSEGMHIRKKMILLLGLIVGIGRCLAMQARAWTAGTRWEHSGQRAAAGMYLICMQVLCKSSCSVSNMLLQGLKRPQHPCSTVVSLTAFFWSAALQLLHSVYADPHLHWQRCLLVSPHITPLHVVLAAYTRR